MKRLRFISASIGVAASLLSLSVSGVIVASDDTDVEELETEGGESETKESKKKSRFSSLKMKVKKEVDKSTVVQAGKNFARQTGEAAKAVGDVGKATGQTGIAIGKSAIQTRKDKLTSKKQEEEAVSSDEQKKSSPSVKEAAKNLTTKTGEAAKKVEKAGLAGAELSAQVGSVHTRAAIRIGQSVGKKVAERSSKKDKEQVESAEPIREREPIDQKHREQELERLGKEKEKERNLEEKMPVAKSQPEKKHRERQLLIGKKHLKPSGEEEKQRKLDEAEEQRKLEEELARLNEEFEKERRKMEEEIHAESQPEKQHKLEKEERTLDEEYEEARRKIEESLREVESHSGKPLEAHHEGIQKEHAQDDREELIQAFQDKHPDMTRGEIENLLDD